VLANPKPKYQRSTFFVLRYTTKSDPISELKKPGSPMSRREEHPTNCRIRISAGRQHIAFEHLVKENFHQIMKSFYRECQPVSRRPSEGGIKQDLIFNSLNRHRRRLSGSRRSD
jgi:hypothetical protein